MNNLYDIEVIDAGEVRRIAGVHRQVVGHRGGGDQCVQCSSVGLPAGSPERRSDSPKGASCFTVKRKRVEVRLGLLEVGLTSGPRCLFFCHQRTDREFGQCDGGYKRLGGKLCRVPDLGQKNDGRCVEDATVKSSRLAHNELSTTESTSPRSSSGSIGGSRCQRTRRAAAVNPGRLRGRSSATGFPPRVMITDSPCEARSTTSPP